MVYNGWMEIPLTRGFVAQVDEADAAFLMRYRWYACTPRRRALQYTYAHAVVDGRRVYMHRLLMGNPPQEVDHINQDTLDNRRANLRLVTASQQRQNSVGQPNRRKSPYKGVFWWKNPKLSFGGYWKAVMRLNGRTYYKHCKTEIEAAKAYNEMARRHFGEFARLNVIAEAS